MIKRKELEELGPGLAVVTRNAVAVWSLTRVLRFGISDRADVIDR
jgi:hypothetical protein